MHRIRLLNVAWQFKNPTGSLNVHFCVGKVEEIEKSVSRREKTRPLTDSSKASDRCTSSSCEVSVLIVGMHLCFGGLI